MMTKRIVMAFGLDSKRIDPDFCTHDNDLHIIADGDEWLQCYDCGAMIDEFGEVVHVASRDIPVFPEDLA